MDDLITPAEAARLRGVTRSAITHLMKRGRLRVVEVGGRSFLDRSEVEGFTPEITGRPPKSPSEITAKLTSKTKKAAKKGNKK